jgi:hypothetical protein
MDKRYLNQNPKSKYLDENRPFTERNYCILEIYFTHANSGLQSSFPAAANEEITNYQVPLTASMIKYLDEESTV